ncbi:Uncharacterised protein [uncultured archaeon]|nr:Uncharacterised protein [uncultured archaeon]
MPSAKSYSAEMGSFVRFKRYATTSRVRVVALLKSDESATIPARRSSATLLEIG